MLKAKPLSLAACSALPYILFNAQYLVGFKIALAILSWQPDPARWGQQGWWQKARSPAAGQLAGRLRQPEKAAQFQGIIRTFWNPG